MMITTPHDDRKGHHGGRAVAPAKQRDYGNSTIVFSKCSSVAAGSVQRPEWTGEVWMMVLRGETSQWKRSDCESWPMAPASALPAHTRGIMSRCRCTISRSTAGY